MPQALRKKHHDLPDLTDNSPLAIRRRWKWHTGIVNYLKSCSQCPALQKLTPSPAERIIDGVLKKLNQPPTPRSEQFYCPYRKCIVNPDKGRDCAYRDKLMQEQAKT